MKKTKINKDTAVVAIRYRRRPVAVYLHSVRRRANGLLNITLKTIYP